MATRIQKNCGVSRRRGSFPGLVHHEIAVVQGLDTEVIKVEVCGGINSLAKFSDVNIELEQVSYPAA